VSAHPHAWATAGRAYAPGAPASAIVAWAAALAERTAHDTVLRRFLQRVAAHPERVAYRTLRAGGAESDATLTWADWARAARAVAGALVGGGLPPGGRVAVLAGNGPLWPVMEMGVLLAGGVTLGVFPTSTTAQARELCVDGAARVIVCDDAAQLAKARAAREGATEIPLLVSAAHDDGPAPAIDFAAWMRAGARLLDDPALTAELDRRIAAAAPSDLAILIYTSGSTGEPKGACIPHAYLLASAESVRDTLGLTAADRALSVLPYAHASERVFGMHTRLVCGMEGGLVADPSRMWEAARAFRPTLFGGLPRLYEKLHDALAAAERASEGEARDAWSRLRTLGAERSRLRRAGAAVPAELEARWQQVRGVAAAALDALLGDRVRLATSGGAPLRRDVAESLDAAGLTVLGAYGQTEHLCVAFHRPEDYDFDGVGLPMPETTLRIADDGEILVRRGALTFAGYLDRQAETRAAFTDDGAWLRTGDLGTLDARGRLHVTGRVKEMLALSTGKKVAPLPIEARLRAHPAIAQALVAGEGRRFATALLFAPDAPDSAATRAELATHVESVNADLAPHERVARWALVPEELTEADGALTPTLKLRRAVIEARYHALLEGLYA
jgi:long-chain acyl-CoA synthetase